MYSFFEGELYYHIIVNIQEANKHIIGTPNMELGILIKGIGSFSL